jgi:oligosaccharyltransferase complex subunit epsilon
MPPKQRTPASTGTATTNTSSSRPVNSKSSNDAQDILQGVWNKYVKNTPQRTKLLDTFMAFLVVVGALQFLYVVLVGNFVRPSTLSHWPALYNAIGAQTGACSLRIITTRTELTMCFQPFNAFLSGFSACVGQFVLTASLRMQTNTENKVHFENISHERAFADFVFGSLLLHFFCVNFIN